MIHCLRHGRRQRQPRTGGVDRRGQIPERVSIHLRPPEVDKRVIAGHWEGDLIKGKDNASAAGTLVELTGGYVMLIKMNGLIRQYLPKGTDLSVHSQAVLDEIALALNMRPRKHFRLSSAALPTLPLVSFLH